MDNIHISEYISKYGRKLVYDKERNKFYYRNRRHELVDRLVKGINKDREGTKYPKVIDRVISIKINKNPFLAHSDDELELLIKECEERGNFSKFWWVVNSCKEVNKKTMKLDL